MFMQIVVPICLLLSFICIHKAILIWDDEKMSGTIKLLMWSMLGSWIVTIGIASVFTFPFLHEEVISFDAYKQMKARAKYTFVHCKDNQCMVLPTTPVLRHDIMVSGDEKTTTVFTKQVVISDPQKFYQTDISLKQKKTERMFRSEKIIDLLLQYDKLAFDKMIERNKKYPLLSARLDPILSFPSPTERQIHEVKTVIADEENAYLARWGLAVIVQHVSVDGGVK